MSTTEPPDEHSPAWMVTPGLFMAGGRPATWTLPARPTTVVRLCRSASDGYPDSPFPVQRVLHRPLTYWESADPRALLLAVVEETAACAEAGQTLVHCTLGLDRSGIVALGLLIRAGAGFEQAVEAYRERGVRMPREDAWDVLVDAAPSLARAPREALCG